MNTLAQSQHLASSISTVVSRAETPLASHIHYPFLPLTSTSGWHSLLLSFPVPYQLPLPTKSFGTKYQRGVRHKTTGESSIMALIGSGKCGCRSEYYFSGYYWYLFSHCRYSNFAPTSLQVLVLDFLSFSFSFPVPLPFLLLLESFDSAKRRRANFHREMTFRYL